MHTQHLALLSDNESAGLFQGQPLRCPNIASFQRKTPLRAAATDRPPGVLQIGEESFVLQWRKSHGKGKTEVGLCIRRREHR